MRVTEVHLKSRTTAPFDVKKFLATSGRDHSIKKFPKGAVIFEQGGPADAIFFIRGGKVKITVLSTRGKEAVVGVLSVGQFFGEGALNGQQVRMSTATSMDDCTIVTLSRWLMLRTLKEQPGGKVKITVLSTRGKEAVVGVLSVGQFFGEGALNGQQKERRLR